MRDSSSADALAAVLASGVVHHDVKPANLLLTGIADYDTVVVLKAGIRKLRARRDQVAIGQTASAFFAIDLGTTYSHALHDNVRYDVAPDPAEMASDTVGALLATLRASPFSLFAVRAARPPGYAPSGASLRLLVEDLGREGLLRFLNIILAAFSLALVLLLSALAHRPAVLAFTLLLVAVSRCFGRRGEPDDLLVSARQSLSAVAGRQSERR